MKVLIPTTTHLELARIPGVSFVHYHPDEPLAPQHQDAEALVVWGNSSASLKEAARKMTRLRWVQTLAAGPNSLLEAGFADEVILTSGRGLHDGTVAEHSLALLLAACRRVHEMRDAQRAREWPGHLGGMQPVRAEGNFRSLDGANVVIWGFGSIAARLAPLLAALGAEVQGVARSSGVRHGFPVSAEEDIEKLLPASDALVMILPSTPGTKDALNAERLSFLPPHAWVVNVGRGDTVDEEALVTALREDRLGGAALDVFETEPLPEDSPLWGFDNVIISPHAAGGRPVGAAALIARNAENLLCGRDLENVVDRERGY